MPDAVGEAVHAPFLLPNHLHLSVRPRKAYLYHSGSLSDFPLPHHHAGGNVPIPLGLKGQ